MFRAYDSARERLVAVKLFKLDLPPERGHQLVAEFERLIAAHLTHPAIAAPLATGISGVCAFLVQEFVAADSLDLAIREHGPVPASHALRVAAPLAAALDFAAAAYVTHGALHPRDVLLSSDETRLTGLGVTRALERIGVVAPVRRPYTAPERIAGEEWDRRADVFSLAALMHELLWGRRVSGLGAQAADSLTDIPGADLSALRAVFARALAELPAERFGTALQFTEALTKACPDVVQAVARAQASKRRAPVREGEPRLPLDEDVEPAARVEEAVDLDAGAPIGTPAEPPATVAPVAVRVAPVDVSVAQGFSRADLPVTAPVAAQDAPSRDVEIAPPIAAPEIVRDVVPAIARYEPPTAIPVGLITGYDPDSLSALERTRSAIWPLVLALIVGLGIGFAGGFLVGGAGAGSREPAAAAVTATAPVAAGREVTEAAVPAAAPAQPAQPNPELRTQNSEPKNLQSEISNLKSPAGPGRLLVRSRPAGARVSVDGKDAGLTPATVRALARGAHRVTIVHDGYAAEERRVVITTKRPSQSMTVALARPRAAASRAAQTASVPPGRVAGALAVASRPAGARVYMDGTLVGTTPMSLASVPAGSHAIRLEHDGYRRWSSSVRIVAGEQNRVTASLER